MSLLDRKRMAASIFYVICGLSLLFFAAFFIQCCRSAARKSKQVINELSVSDVFTAAGTARLFAQWEREMTEFLERQGRSTAFLLLIGAGSLGLLGSTIPCAHSDGMVARLDQLSACVFDRNTSPDLSQGEQSPCKKN